MSIPPAAEPSVPSARSGWERRLFWLLPALALIAGSTGAAAVPAVPDWARWSLLGVALSTMSCLGIAVLLGPAARRLAGEAHPLTPGEQHQLTAVERIEAINAARNTLIQAATGLVIIGGVVFTAQGLWYTAQTLDVTRQGQITDRYTKAVEQLGSDKLDIRLGGIYALERVATDSTRDHQAIYEVLCAFAREHSPPPQKPTAAPPAGSPTSLATDVQAALTVIAHRDVRYDAHPVNLHQARIAGADLAGAKLGGADLIGAKLAGADLTDADLWGADLTRADLWGVNLTRADLTRANLKDTTGGTAISSGPSDAD